MTDITALAQREKFESWLEGAEALPWGYLKKRRISDEAYRDPNTTDMWGAWQAANAEMLEVLEKVQCANAAQDDHINQQQDRISILEKRNAELGKHVGTLEKRLRGTEESLIASVDMVRELESRTVTAAHSDYFASLVAMARVSADKAMRKFPQPNYVLLKVAEEAGEVVQAGVHYAEKRMEWDQVEGEIVQLLAMLIRLVTEGDQINGITPPAAGIKVIEGEGQ